MSGISDKAIKNQYAENKYRFNDGTELANKEFSDGSGLEMYETDFRGYDPQIGRFWQIDPFGELFEEWSSYSFAFDNPIVYNDPLGLDPEEANNSGDKKKKHKHKDRSGPLDQTLQEVVVIGHRPTVKSHSSRNVTAARPITRRL
jgi:RHS repeat-associated protein